MRFALVLVFLTGFLETVDLKRPKFRAKTKQAYDSVMVRNKVEHFKDNECFKRNTWNLYKGIRTLKYEIVEFNEKANINGGAFVCTFPEMGLFSNEFIHFLIRIFHIS